MSRYRGDRRDDQGSPDRKRLRMGDTPRVPSVPVDFATWSQLGSAGKADPRCTSLFASSAQRFVAAAPRIDPELEIIRGSIIQRVRSLYGRRCRELLGIEEPKNSFARFLLTRIVQLTEAKCLEDACLPTLPASTREYLSVLAKGTSEPPAPPDAFMWLYVHPLWREVEEDLPVKLRMFCDSHSSTVSQMYRYVDALRDVRRSIPRDDDAMWDDYYRAYDACRDQVADVKKMDSSAPFTLADGRRILTKLRETGDPVVRKVMSPALRQLCREVLSELDSLVRSRVLTYKPSDTERHAVVCVEDVSEDRKSMELRYRQERPLYISLDRAHMLYGAYVAASETLRSLSSLSTSVTIPDFPSALWCLLRRYKTFMGEFRVETAASLHAALPEALFRELETSLSVDMEAFASPLNAQFLSTLGSYCSAFNDVDVLFGSLGSFFSLDSLPDGVCMEMNPPFEDLLMEHLSSMIQGLFSQAEQEGRNVAAVLVFPDWQDPPCASLERISAVPYVHHRIVFAAQQHQFVSGLKYQTTASQSERQSFHAIHSTRLIFLHTAGFEKKITAEMEDRLRRAFR